ncbi:4Fe-4S binding protein [Pseudomonas sp. H3_A05]
MSDRIPVQLIQTFEPAPTKIKARSTDNLIHTRSFTGLFRTLRISGAGVLFLLFFGTVWLNWGGRQAVLWDLSESKFHIFGATFWPQDFILLSALLIIAAFGLFAITVFAGRVWCGYTCPQSSWTWIFMWCEKITEGERNQRIKLAGRALGPEQTLAPQRQAHAVAGHQPAHRPDVRGVLHTDPPLGRRTADPANGRRESVLGALLYRSHLSQRRLAA